MPPGLSSGASISRQKDSVSIGVLDQCEIVPKGGLERSAVALIAVTGHLCVLCIHGFPCRQVELKYNARGTRWLDPVRIPGGSCTFAGQEEGEFTHLNRNGSLVYAVLRYIHTQALIEFYCSAHI